MAYARDLYKTKLCTLHQKGHCPRLSCSFAHGEAELRRFPGVGGFNGTSGRHDNHRGGEFRDRLNRHGSPDRRHSLRRDGDGRQGSLSDRRLSSRDKPAARSGMRSSFKRRASRSYTPPRSPSLESESRKSKKIRVEAPDARLNDVSGDRFAGDKEERNRRKSPPTSFSENPLSAFQEQLREVRLENKALLDEKEKLKKELGKRTEEGSLLAARNAELDIKLSNALADCRRFGSKMKKLLKIFLRCSRAQDEVKRTQSKLRKIAEDFANEASHRPTAYADDSEWHNVSSGELERPTNGISVDGMGILSCPET